MAAVVAAALAMMAVGVVVAQRHRAAAAADAVALKVALESIEGPAIACRDGGVLGRLDGAGLGRCVLDGSVAEVDVEVPLPGVLKVLGPATGRARAGPVSIAAPP
jgi:secretion/DNA translocation related TadE-like protein